MSGSDYWHGHDHGKQLLRSKLRHLERDRNLLHTKATQLADYALTQEQKLHAQQALSAAAIEHAEQAERRIAALEQQLEAERARHALALNDSHDQCAWLMAYLGDVRAGIEPATH